jgi:hypothetical protein
MSCTLVGYIQVAAAVLSGLAGVLWFLASRTPIPSMDIDRLVIRDMGKISDALQRQGRWNFSIWLIRLVPRFVKYALQV